MKKLLLLFIFTFGFQLMAFAQNDKLIVGKWKMQDMKLSAEQLKKIPKEQLEGIKTMVKKMSENSYYEFFSSYKVTVLMDIGFGNPEPLTSVWRFDDKKKTTLTIDEAKSGTEGNSQSMKKSSWKILKISKKDLTMEAIDGEQKGVKLVFVKN